MAGSSRQMQNAKMHTVMKKKTVSSIGARAFSLKVKQRALAERAKVDALKLKVKKAALKVKEQEKKSLTDAKEKVKADVAAAKAKEEALLSPEALREKLKLESLVSKDFPAVIQKIVKDDAEEQRLIKEQLGSMDVEEFSAEELEKLDASVDAAMKVYKDMWIEFVFEYDRTNGNGEDREQRASDLMEKRVAERYEELRAVATNLLPFLPAMRPAEEGSDYNVFEVEPRKTPEHLKEGAVNWRLLASQYPSTGAPALEKVMGATLACFRRDPKFRAVEAFCAMMAVMSSRKEKSFLEIFSTRQELESEMRRLQKKGLKVQSKGSSQRKHEIRKWLAKQEYQGLGYFAHYLGNSHATMRVAFRPGVPAPLPVSVIAVERITLFDALGSPDSGDGSFIGAPKSYDWCRQEGTEFAFQAARLGIPEENPSSYYGREHREPIDGLKANSQLRELLLSRKPIVYLEATAALASREVAKREGLSAIVIAELTKLMRDAKSRGEAVLFCLGSDSPHKLAEKVYLRKPIGDYGLTCGYFRWRRSANVPWAREAFWEDRPCHCLQMP